MAALVLCVALGDNGLNVQTNSSFVLNGRYVKTNCTYFLPMAFSALPGKELTACSNKLFFLIMWAINGGSSYACWYRLMMSFVRCAHTGLLQTQNRNYFIALNSLWWCSWCDFCIICTMHCIFVVHIILMLNPLLNFSIIKIGVTAKIWYFLKQFFVHPTTWPKW